MGFQRDAAFGQKGVDLVLNELIDRDFIAHELEGKREQKLGDICWYQDEEMNESLNLEIKYDMMSERTGNICFEVSNSRNMTGVMLTRADRIVYVCPYKGGHTVFFFDPEALRNYLFDTLNKKVSFKNGGDKNKFMLALVKIEHITSDASKAGLLDTWKVPNA